MIAVAPSVSEPPQAALFPSPPSGPSSGRRPRRSSAPAVVSFLSAAARKAPHDKASISRFVDYLDGVDAFATLGADKKHAVAIALCQTEHCRGERIVVQGDVGDRFYILTDGVVSVSRDGRQVNELVGSAGSPQFFGERALLNRDLRAATVTVASSTAKTLSLDKASFDLLIAPSLAGPRRVAAAVSRRLLEDARERHVLRSEYMARKLAQKQGETLPREMLGVILVEVLGDVRAAVKASRTSRVFVQSLLDAAADTACRRAWKLKQRLHTWRCLARCVGKLTVLHNNSKLRVANEDAWMDLQTSIAAISKSLGVGSFALGSRPPQKSVGLGSNTLRAMGIGSRCFGTKHCCGGEVPTVTLRGGSVSAALRSARKSLVKQGGALIPRRQSAIQHVGSLIAGKTNPRRHSFASK